MNKKDYQKLMDSMHAPDDLENKIYERISLPKKTYYKPLTVGLVTICLIMTLIGFQNLGSHSNIPFVIEVQAKEELKQIDSDKQMEIEMKNEIINQEENENGFYISTTTENGQITQNLLITLPLQIKGENISTIEYSVNQENNYLIPRYSLENLIVGDDEQTINAINEHIVTNPKEKNEFGFYKCFSEMSEAGQIVFKRYIEMYKDILLKDSWWQELGNTEDDFYKDEYTSILIFMIRTLSYQYYQDDEIFLRQLRLNEYRYFDWGRKEKTKQYTYPYNEQQLGNIQLLIQLTNTNDDYSIERIIDNLDKSVIELKVTYENGTIESKSLSFKNINAQTGEYSLVII